MSMSFVFCQCSVTCGEGQQMREVNCMGPGGERLGDYACSRQSRPALVQTCSRPACQMQITSQITWHVTEYGLVGT